MRPLTVEEIAKAVEGKLVSGSGSTRITGVSTDTRKICPGELFFALIGENSDGHRYIDKAYENGCRAVVTSRKVEVPQEMAVIETADTLRALQILAKKYLEGFPGLIRIGVTGSTGKTSTKELLYWSLCGKYQTARNVGNFNNHIGMPLTALRVEETDEAAIFEMGMGHFGEVDLLADIGRPEMALITNIGVSHIADLGSRENILQAKLEITNYFDENSKLVINFDNDLLSGIDWSKKKYKVIKVGKNPEAEYRILNVKNLGEEGVLLTMQIEGREYEFFVPIPGIHNGHNGAMAVAAAVEAGVSPEAIARTICQCQRTDKRLVIYNSPEGIKIIDDTYNASPDSMKAGIEVLRSAEGERKLAILGDMLGMGPETERYHREVGEYAGICGLDLVLSVGTDARYISDSAAAYLGRERAFHFDTREDLISHLPELVKPGDVVLLKASRAMGMEKITEYLRKDRSRRYV